MSSGQDRMLVQGSECRPVSEMQCRERAEETALLTVTVILHPQEEFLESRGARRGGRITAGALARLREKQAASETAIAKVHAFAEQFGLAVVETLPEIRTVKLCATVKQMEQAFHVDLYTCAYRGGMVRGRIGGVLLPASLAERVSGVFGLDDLPIEGFSVCCKTAVRQLAQNGKFTQTHVSSVLRDSRRSSKPTVILLEFCLPLEETSSQSRYDEDDIADCFHALRLSPPSLRWKVIDDSLDARRNDRFADARLLLDIQWIGITIPDTDIVVCFVPRTEQGWIDALNAACFQAFSSPIVLVFGWNVPVEITEGSGQLLREQERILRLIEMLGIACCCIAELQMTNLR